MSSIVSSTLHITSEQENYFCANLLQVIKLDNERAVEEFVDREPGMIIKDENGVSKFIGVIGNASSGDEVSCLIYAIFKKCLKSANAILNKYPELALVPSKFGFYPINSLLEVYMEIPQNNAVYPFMVVILFKKLSEACLNTRLIDNREYFKEVLESLSANPYLAQELCPILKKVWLEHRKDEIKMVKSNAAISGFLIEKEFPHPLTSIVTDYLCLRDIINTQEIITDNQVSIHGYIPEINANLTNRPYNLLCSAIDTKNEAAVRLLIELGANPNYLLDHPKYIGKSIMDYAREACRDMVPLLAEGLPKDTERHL